MKSARGFTLMEVMIALVILSMMMVAMVASLRTFANTSTTLERMIGRVDHIRLVSAFLRRSIEAAVPVVEQAKSGITFDVVTRHKTYFSGMRTELIWVAPVATGAGFNGVNFLHLRRDEQVLALRWLPYSKAAAPGDWDSVKPRPLLENVEEFTVSYRASYDGEWLEEWVDPMANPVSLKMNIKAEGKYWPELIIRLD